MLVRILACLIAFPSPQQLPPPTELTDYLLHFPRVQTLRFYWWDSLFLGRATASGLPFHPGLPFVGHRTLPLGTIVNLRHGSQSAHGVVLDREVPRGTDLVFSHAIASRLGLLRNKTGIVTLEIEGIEPRSRWPLALGARNP